MNDLIKAAKANGAQALRALLDAGANPDIKDSNGKTAEIRKLLREHGQSE